MANHLAGKVEITLDGNTHTLRYDWNGIAELTRLYPDGYNLMDPQQLATIIAVGLKHEMPDLTPQQIMDMSPPIIDTMEAVGSAINCAYFGTPKAPAPEEKAEDENPQKKAAKRA
jgi:hypothetical protein